MARFLNDNGMICLASLIAPDESVRSKAADLIGSEKFVVVHCDAPLDLCKQRDPRGHYKQAESGELPALPGDGADYQTPASPDLRLDTSELTIEECVEKVVELLRSKQLIH